MYYECHEINVTKNMKNFIVLRMGFEPMYVRLKVLRLKPLVERSV